MMTIKISLKYDKMHFNGTNYDLKMLKNHAFSGIISCIDLKNHAKESRNVRLLLCSSIESAMKPRSNKLDAGPNSRPHASKGNFDNGRFLLGPMTGDCRSSPAL